MIEPMETRRMMSVTPAGDAVTEPATQSALLLPAVQKVREAAARSTPSVSEITVTKPTDTASPGL
jgi:hypothetical protein